jgi:hypothetical protein
MSPLAPVLLYLTTVLEIPKFEEIFALLSVHGISRRGIANRRPGHGDGEFTATGTYSAGPMVKPLTAPGQSFTISFDLPTNPTSLKEDYDTGDDFYLNAIPASYTYTVRRPRSITHYCPSIPPTRLANRGIFRGLLRHRPNLHDRSRLPVDIRWPAAIDRRQE